MHSASTFLSKAVGLFILLLGAAHLSTAAEVHPIVDAESGYLLGGSSNGAWLSADAVAGLLQGGETYTTYSLNRLIGHTKGDKPASEGAPCPDTYGVNIAPKEGTIAVGGSWNAMPRAVKSLDVTQPVYRWAVAAILKKNGIAHPHVKITKILRVDLDGDGEPEVLISATNHAGTSSGGISPNSKAGEYSLVLLRKFVHGKVKTIVLDESYYPRAKTFNAPEIYTIGAVLDLKGDGKMEIVVRSRYYEGDATIVYAVSGEKVIEVLSAGCGA